MSLRAIVGEQRRRDIVSISLFAFGRMGRRHTGAVGVDDQSGQQAWSLRACSKETLASICGEPVLDDPPELRIDDRVVLARVGRALVDDLAAIDAILQQEIERAAREWLAARQTSAGPARRLLTTPKRSSSAFSSATEPSSA